MDKEFIPYEQALALKELGFNQKCLGQYNISQGDKWVFSIDLSGEGQYPLTSPACITPLYQQAFRWFRDKHELDSEIYMNHENGVKIYTYLVLKLEKRIISHKSGYAVKQNTYEEAELECLKKLIEIVKK